MNGKIIVGLLLAVLANQPVVNAAAADTSTFLAGADISALPSLEKAGAVYRDGDKPGDAIAILRTHGCNLFRVRLFVSPDQQFNHTGGAVQDLDYVIPLAKRIKASGAKFLLDLHYSDTWSDASHEPTPAAWVGLSPTAMVDQVHDYTVDVLRQLAAANASPDMVQIGNEVMAGILWPTGQLYPIKKDAEQQQWQEFSRLLNAGARAIREESAAEHRNIRVVLHVDRGGRPACVWFFQKLSETPVDFDIMGLSFYPEWGDEISTLKENLATFLKTYHKDILICETGYPWKQVPDLRGKAMQWPQTPAGQKQFLQQLVALLRSQPEGRVLGYAWWYPESVQVKGLFIWRNGADAWFDGEGKLLPAAQELGGR